MPCLLVQSSFQDQSTKSTLHAPVDHDRRDETHHPRTSTRPLWRYTRPATSKIRTRLFSSLSLPTIELVHDVIIGSAGAS